MKTSFSRNAPCAGGFRLTLRADSSETPGAPSGLICLSETFQKCAVGKSLVEPGWEEKFTRLYRHLCKAFCHKSAETL